VFKSLCLFAHLLNGYLLWRLAKDHRHQSTLTLAYLVCPILLFEHVAQAHVDVFLTTSILLLLHGLTKDKAMVACCALLLGALTKTVPIIWAPLLLVFLLKARNFRVLLGILALVLAVAGGLALTWLPSLSAWASLLNPGVKWNSAGSLHNIAETCAWWLRDILPPSFTQGRIHQVLAAGSNMAIGLWYLSRMLRIYRRNDRDMSKLVLDFGWTLLLILVFATPWFQPWYATALLPFVLLSAIQRPFKDQRAFVYAGLALACTSTSYYLFAILGAPRVLFLILSMVTMGPPVGILVYQRAWKAGWSKRPNELSLGGDLT
jgi:alpha-1,6-mannosyltransferase